MTYRIKGLCRADFDNILTASDDELAARGDVRVVADSDRGYPCRVSLRDAKLGERLVLLNYVSHDVATPFRTAYAIYVREDAEDQPDFVDSVPPMLESRTLGLRGFDEQGMLRAARLAIPGEADAAIRALLANDVVAYIHAHNAAHGCFLAAVQRD